MASRYRGNNERCPTCGVTYGQLRTGLTYREVHDWLWSNDDDPTKWKYKRRGTVLGLWHQHKKEMWLHHLQTACEGITAGDSFEGFDAPNVIETLVQGVPF